MSYVAFALYAFAGFTALSGIIAVFVPRSNTLAQSMLVLGGVAGLAGIVLRLLAPAGTQVVLGGGLFALSPLSMFFFGLIALGIILAGIFAIGYLPRYAAVFPASRVNAATSVFVLGMAGAVLANTLPAFLISWELMSIAAYFLVIADREAASLSAGFLYFVMTQLGFVSLLAAFLILAQGNAFLTWDELTLTASALSPGMVSAAFLLALVGFGSKAGLVPLHAWLPYAHPQAPSHASALLSGVMLNVALYGFIRTAFVLPFIATEWLALVIVLGLLSAVFGAVHAATEADAKKLLAYSSIENMGLIFTGIGIALILQTLPPSSTAAVLLTGAIIFVVLHIINHFLFKLGLFMAVGAVASGAHSRDLDELGGLAQRWPIFAGVFLALAIAAGALPPLGTFFGEWFLVQTLALAIAAMTPLYAGIALAILSTVALVGGLALFAAVKLFSVAFLGRARTEHAAHAGKLPLTMTIPPFLCALGLGATAIGAGPAIMVAPSILDALGRGVVLAPGAAVHPLWTIVAFGILLIAVWSVRTLVGDPRVRVTDTWDCGQPITPRMQYTATGFSAPIRFFFRSLVVATKQLVRTPVVATNPWIAKRRIEWDVTSIWERWLYRSVSSGTLRIAHAVRKLQSGVVQAYLLLVLVTLIATILYAI